MQKLIILLSSVFILISYFLLPTPVIAHGDEHEELIIRMTNEGFEPRELTVIQGDEVLFINNDDVDRWPASNFHPTHTLYSEFDPLQKIPPGESWTFTLNKPGTWRMHDHLIPHMTGTIVVLEDLKTEAEKGPTLDADSQGLTLKNPGLWAKIKNFFLKLFSKPKSSATSEFKVLNEKEKYSRLEEVSSLEGPEVAWQLVLDTYNTSEGVIGNPHDMTHLVGQLLFKEYGFGGLSTCNPSFAFGCYHGLMEVAFDKDKPEEYQDNLKRAQTGCEIVGPTTSPSYWSCIHGMGHGITTFREHDMGLSISDCDFLPEKFVTYCQDGVFMEFSISAPPSFYKIADPLYPCDIVAEKAKIACARSQVQVMRLRFGLKTSGIARICNNSGNKNINFHCIDALGYFIAQTSAGNPSLIINSCREIEDESAIAQCTEAAAGELVFQNFVGWQKAVEKVCASLDETSRLSCKTRVASVQSSYER